MDIYEHIFTMSKNGRLEFQRFQRQLEKVRDCAEDDCAEDDCVEGDSSPYDGLTDTGPILPSTAMQKSKIYLLKRLIYGENS